MANYLQIDTTYYGDSAVDTLPVATGKKGWVRFDTNGAIFISNGTGWASSGGSGSITSLDDIPGVDLTTSPPANGNVLTYSTSGTKWVPAAPPGAGGGITASSVDILSNKTILDSAAGNQLGVHVPYTFTIYQDASNYIIRNNSIGILQTFPNTDFTPALKWAIDNIVNVGLGTQSSLYAGGIFVERGKYISITSITPSITTATRHGVVIRGEGWGTEINFNPSGTLPDGFLIDLAAFSLRDLRITANDKVTNLIHLIGHGSGQRRNDHFYLDNLQIEGPNGNAGWATLPHVPNQIAILIDGTSIASYYSTIKNCRIHSFEKGIWFNGLHATSCFCKDNAFKWCETGIEVSNSSGQLQIDGAWIQGDTFTGTTGIDIKSTAGGYIYIDHVTSELHRENPALTPVACQTVLIGTGIGNCFIGKHISNAFDGTNALYKTIVNNSTQVNHTPLNWGWRDKNFFTLDYTNDLVTLDSSRRMAIRSGMLYLQGTNALNMIFTLAGNLASSRVANFPVLLANDQVTFDNHITTLIGKSMSGLSNTFTNIPDTALSANIPLKNAANVFTNTQKISVDNGALTTFYRPVNTAGFGGGFLYNFNNNAGTPAEVSYGNEYVSIEDPTAAAHRGDFNIQLAVAAALGIRFRVFTFGNGGIIFGNNQRGLFSEDGLTIQRTFTLPNANALLVGTDTAQALSQKTITAPVLDSYVDLNRIAAPANPGTNVARLYHKQKDTNNDGIFTRIKVGGAISEVELGVADDALNLNDLADVIVASPAVNQVPVYQTGSATFENKKLKTRQWLTTTVSTTANGTRFQGWGSSAGSLTTEASIKTPLYSAMTLKRVTIRVQGNGKDGVTLFSIRKNEADITGTTHSVAAGVTTSAPFDSSELTVGLASGDFIAVKADLAASTNAGTMTAIITTEYEVEAFA